MAATCPPICNGSTRLAVSALRATLGLLNQNPGDDPEFGISANGNLTEPPDGTFVLAVGFDLIREERRRRFIDVDKQNDGLGRSAADRTQSNITMRD